MLLDLVVVNIGSLVVEVVKHLLLQQDLQVEVLVDLMLVVVMDQTPLLQVHNLLVLMEP